MTSHLFRLSQLEPQIQTEGGLRLAATKNNFPLLQGMSLYKLVLQPKAVRAPHWHANADELGYCLQGTVLISFYASGNQKETYLVHAGEAFFIPSGSLHAIENAGEEKAELVLQFSHEEPEDFSLLETFGMFSHAILGNTWNLPPQVFKEISHSPKNSFIAIRSEPIRIPKEARYSSMYRFPLHRSVPLIDYPFGTAKVARKNVWPILKRQSLYSLELTANGMREPHWHPETAEMGYVAKGRGRMSILSPNGNQETYEMNAGDLYFIPKAYPHHIECLADSLHILIFFDQVMPGDIGFTGSVKSFSNASLAAVFHTSEEFFGQLPTYYEDLFMVEKKF